MMQNIHWAVFEINAEEKRRHEIEPKIVLCMLLNLKVVSDTVRNSKTVTNFAANLKSFWASATKGGWECGVGVGISLSSNPHSRWFQLIQSHNQIVDIEHT